MSPFECAIFGPARVGRTPVGFVAERKVIEAVKIQDTWRLKIILEFLGILILPKKKPPDFSGGLVHLSNVDS